jgi:hypothetical protein
MILGLKDPDPLVRGTDLDPDPSIMKQKNKKILDSYCFVTVYDFLSLKMHLQKLIRKTTLMKIAGSVSQRYGYSDPDPYQIVMDPQHWPKQRISFI